MLIKAPLVIDASGELLLFRDVSSMENYLEPIDVHNGEYLVYDSEGRKVLLTTAVESSSSLFGLIKGSSEHVRVSAVEDPPSYSQVLSAKIRRTLENLSVDAPAAASLSELIALLLSRTRFVA